jgi:quercetin dioxygenase-like cupin family protein
MTKAHITPPNHGRTIAVVGDVYRFLATSEDTDGHYAIWEALVTPGGGPPLHVHSRETEGFFVLDGEMTFYVEDEVIRAQPGTWVHVPIGIRHRFQNESTAPARMLIQVAPGGLEKMFFETGVPVAPGTTVAPPVSHEEIERLLAVAPKYGVTIFPPS